MSAIRQKAKQDTQIFFYAYHDYIRLLEIIFNRQKIASKGNNLHTILNVTH